MTIIFDRESRVALAECNVLSLIGTEVTPEDVVSVWDAVFQFIEETLAEGRGVKIPGLATLSYKKLNRDVSSKYLTIEKHAFLLIDKGLVDQYALQSQRPPYTLVPSAELNLAWIAKKTGLKRSDVQTCVDEVTHAFRSALVNDDHVEFHFDGIGKIFVRCNKATYSLRSDFMSRHAFGYRSYYDKNCLNCVIP